MSKPLSLAHSKHHVWFVIVAKKSILILHMWNTLYRLSFWEIDYDMKYFWGYFHIQFFSSYFWKSKLGGDSVLKSQEIQVSLSVLGESICIVLYFWQTYFSCMEFISSNKLGQIESLSP